MQWVFLGLGVVLVVPYLMELLGGLSLPSFTKKEDHNCLTDLVCKWEELADAVHEAGLHDACSKLDEVFPLLIEAREDRKPENKDE